MFFNINLNSFTNAGSLQPILEQPLEKKTGTMFAPPGTKRLIYFIDDLNMPAPDKYGTQSAIALLRQQVDYFGFYDLKKLTMKEIRGVQYLGSMNPTAGSFFIIDRMQRHFATFATLFPETEVLKTIYGAILAGHLQSGFNSDMQKVAPIALSMQLSCCTSRLPTHSCPPLSPSTTRGTCVSCRASSRASSSARQTSSSEPMHLARLWLHESYRVYGDRLVDVSDATRFEDMVQRTARNYFEDFDQDELHAQPLAFSYFRCADGR